MTLTEFLLEFKTHLSNGELVDVRIWFKDDIESMDNLYKQIKIELKGYNFITLAGLSSFIEDAFQEHIAAFQVSKSDIEDVKIGVVKYLHVEEQDINGKKVIII